MDKTPRVKRFRISTKGGEMSEGMSKYDETEGGTNHTLEPTITTCIKTGSGIVTIILPESGITKKDAEQISKLVSAYIRRRKK